MLNPKLSIVATIIIWAFYSFLFLNTKNVSFAFVGEGGTCGCDYSSSDLNSCAASAPECDSSAPYCVGKICQSGNAGQQCTNPNQCKSGICTNNRCQQLDIGANRSLSVNCKSGICGQSTVGDSLTYYQPPITSSPSSNSNNCDSIVNPSTAACQAAGCFYYAGGAGQPKRCASGTPGTQVCGSQNALCYNNQTCSNGSCYGQGGSWCGSSTQGSHNEWCDATNDYYCKENYPVGPDFYCIQQAVIPSATGFPNVSIPPAGGAPQAPGAGYCSDPNRQNTDHVVNGATCSINDTTYNSSGTAYCNYYFGGSMANFFKCNSSQSGVNPGNGTPGSGTNPNVSTAPQGPANGACANEKGGVLKYDNSYCNKKAYNATDAQAGTFCPATYTDHYICKNIDPSTGMNYDDWILGPAGNNICATAPWCLKNQPATDPAGCRTMGVTCGPAFPCCANTQNLACMPFGATGQSTCQYNTNTAPLTPGGPTRVAGQFTPTPGQPSQSSCQQQYAESQMSAGCPCPDGGRCGPGLGCYAQAGGSLNNPSSLVCSAGTGTWCPTSKTLMANSGACLGATPYVSPTPIPDNSWMNECPSVGGNECDTTSCPAGTIHLGGVGSTTGDKACSYYNSNGASTTGSVCCVKQTTANPSPVTTNPSPVTTNPQTGGSTTCANSTTEQCQQQGTAPNWSCLGGWTPNGKVCPAPAICCQKN